MMTSVNVEMVKCACPTASAWFPLESAVKREGKAFCCDACADGHPEHDGC